jgi:hypothetical protein
MRQNPTSAQLLAIPSGFDHRQLTLEGIVAGLTKSRLPNDLCYWGHALLVGSIEILQLTVCFRCTPKIGGSHSIMS